MHLSDSLIAVIVDDLHLARWQSEALLRISDCGDFLILNCKSSTSRRRALRHGLYYALNLLSLKSRQTKRVPVPDGPPIRKVLDFDAETDGAWQRLPPALLRTIGEIRPRLIVKFGMGLLRIPEELSCPVLSYHHGDPREFRGRPAGFYEMLQGRSRIGQIVQVLSNQLDAGTVVAFAETRVKPHSYRATMEQAFRCSPLLLPEAVRNALAATALPIDPEGKVCRLPSNLTVARFAAKVAAAKLRRAWDLLFIEKSWQVATAARADPDPRALLTDFPRRSEWESVRRPRQYRFIADPFPNPHGGVLVEALRRSDGRGEIVNLIDGSATVLCGGRGHYSYPSTLCDEGRWYMLPETAGWSSPRLFELTAEGANAIGPLDVNHRPRIVDPTLHRGGDGRYYLFGSDPGAGGQILRLWTAESLLGRYVEHPRSPVRITPYGARMGGALLPADGRLFRLGQTWAGAYGDGLVLFEILELSTEAYSERELGLLRFGHAKGPHTLNVAGGRLVFDFYEDRFSPLASFRRLRWLLWRRLLRPRP